MLIKSLHYKNFRQFKGEATIEFSILPNRNVTVILGDNTFGKTTLLQMFNWCLYGKAIFNDNADFLLNLELSSTMYNESTEEVIVEICLEYDGKEYNISRKQEYIKKEGDTSPLQSQLRVSYMESGKTICVEQNKDMKDIVNRIMPEDLSGYFFFDTERVQNVADKKELSTAVKGLLGLGVLDNALKHLGHENAKTSVIGGLCEDLKKNDDSEGQAALRKIQEAQESMEEAQNRKEEAENQIDHYEHLKDGLEDKIRGLENTAKLQQQKDKLEREIIDEKEALKNTYSEYSAVYGKNAVWFFAQPLMRQAEGFLEQADISDKGIADVTINTIKDLISRHKCLCGAKIEDGNEAYKHLVEQLKYVPPEFLGTSIAKFQGSMEQRKQIDDDNSFINGVTQKVNEILRSKKRIDEWNDEVSEIERQIEGKENARTYQLNLNDAKNKIDSETVKKEQAIADIATAESNLKRFKKIYDKLSARSDKVKEIRLYLAYAESIRSWIKDYYQASEKKIRQDLQKRVNGIFHRMYHGERELLINEKYQTVLYTVIKETGEKVVSGESEGLIRVKNFAFIAGLVDLAKQKILQVGDKPISSEAYPLILDAPFSNADDIHIANISKELPQVAEQVIMFVMKKDWLYAQSVLKDKTGKMYELHKHGDTYSTITEG